MFNTFVIPTNGGSGVEVTGPILDRPKPRQKRKQVLRACNLCRISRTKCDDAFPCSNCNVKGVKCTKDGANGSKTLSSAILEIDKLQAKVKKLQSGGTSTSCSPSSSGDTPHSADCCKADDPGPHYWKGTYIDIHSSGNMQYFGPSSTFAFLGRISTFLNSVLDKPVDVAELYPEPERCSRPFSDSVLEMPRPQQEFFLNLFWQTYHSLIPILCEISFRDHFDSLWVGNKRQESPLVDIVLALCIQYGRNFVTQSQNSEDDASRWYFNRCRQALAINHWDHPSITMVQACIFMVVYLQTSSQPTSAHAVLSQGIRAAYSIGLHITQKKSDKYEEEHQKRIWWSLFVLDSKLSIELGLPRCIDLSEVCCAPPLDDAELSHHTITNFATSIESITWLSFHVQEVRLLQEARSAHYRFFTDEIRTEDIYKDSKDLERSAELVTQCMKPIQKWADELPDGLKTPRKSGTPFSIDTSPVVVDSNLPLWIQLQRLTLELEYHQNCLIFYRQFINFTPHSTTTTPLADGHATAALNHSIAITSIIHEVLTKNITLNGWYAASHFQWAAALTMITYALAYPVCPPTPAARKWINVAIDVFDILGKDIPIALRAGAVIRELDSNAKSLMDQFRKVLDGFETESSPDQVQSPRIELNQPRAVDDFDMAWPEGDQYNVDMWAGFLSGLESIPVFLEDGDLGLESVDFGETL